jgi:hypothetical protein
MATGQAERKTDRVSVMKNVFVTFCVLVFIAVGIGCDAHHNANAKRLIEPASIPGKTMLAFTGTGEQLAKQGRISLHRRLKGMDDCEIDVWVINSRLVDAAKPKRKITRGTVVLLHPLVTSKTWEVHNLGRQGKTRSQARGRSTCARKNSCRSHLHIRLIHGRRGGASVRRNRAAMQRCDGHSTAGVVQADCPADTTSGKSRQCRRGPGQSGETGRIRP